jgi:hypothetical protein
MLLLVFLTGAVSGCASHGYLADRRRDGMDVVTVAGGVGAGAQTCLGPVKVGVIEVADMVGMRYGSTFRLKAIPREPDELTLNAIVYSGCLLSPLAVEAGIHPVLLCGTLWDKLMRLQYDRFPLDARQRMRGKGRPGFASPSWCQLEVAGGIIVTLRFGVNPCEALDFLLGWASIDLLHDDLGRRPDQPRPPGGGARARP